MCVSCPFDQIVFKSGQGDARCSKCQEDSYLDKTAGICLPIPKSDAEGEKSPKVLGTEFQLA